MHQALMAFLLEKTDLKVHLTAADQMTPTTVQSPTFMHPLRPPFLLATVPHRHPRLAQRSRTAMVAQLLVQWWEALVSVAFFQACALIPPLLFIFSGSGLAWRFSDLL